MTSKTSLVIIIRIIRTLSHHKPSRSTWVRQASFPLFQNLYRVLSCWGGSRLIRSILILFFSSFVIVFRLAHSFWKFHLMWAVKWDTHFLLALTLVCFCTHYRGKTFAIWFLFRTAIVLGSFFLMIAPCIFIWKVATCRTDPQSVFPTTRTVRSLFRIVRVDLSRNENTKPSLPHFFFSYDPSTNEMKDAGKMNVQFFSGPDFRSLYLLISFLIREVIKTLLGRHDSTAYKRTDVIAIS